MPSKPRINENFGDELSLGDYLDDQDSESSSPKGSAATNPAEESPKKPTTRKPRPGKQ